MSYGGYNWVKPSLAVIACDGQGNGCVLWTAGPHIKFEMEDIGAKLDDLGLDDAPKGISIWTGVSVMEETSTLDGHDFNSYLEGDFRAPTQDEWKAITINSCPWDDEDWKLPPDLAINPELIALAERIVAQPPGFLDYKDLEAWAKRLARGLLQSDTGDAPDATEVE